MQNLQEQKKILARGNRGEDTSGGEKWVEGGLRSAFPGDEVDDQVSVQGPQNLFCVLCDPDGWRGKGYGWGGIKKKKRKVRNVRQRGGEIKRFFI